ncbi:MAG TPA: GerMN domain-containing protein [Terracidiphilus sp.]|nr:GerMN domain-containing protein [Terracidiphilus sp.]
MIPRYQTVLFFLLLAASIVMGAVLWQLRNREHQRLLAGEQSTPTQAPEVAPAVQATLMVASDSDDTLMTQELSLPLPQSPNERARAILGKLLDLYAAQDAGHPVPGGASSVLQVFLMPANASRKGNAVSTGNTVDQQRVMIPDAGTPAAPANDTQSGPELAVVNLSGTFAGNHPSGIETESLTVLSICATLHANLPQVMEVRFLVDGQPRDTLAGHADLMRTYLTAEAMPAQGAQP